jgi:hypothetical protein
MCRQLRKLFKRRPTPNGNTWGGRWRLHTGDTDRMEWLREQVRNEMSTTTVAVQLRSVDILRMLHGHRGEGNGDLQRDIEAAGSIESYLESHPIYRHLGESHERTAIKCGLNADMADVLDMPRQVAEGRNLIVCEIDPDTGEAVPWSDVEVTTC